MKKSRDTQRPSEAETPSRLPVKPAPRQSAQSKSTDPLTTASAPKLVQRPALKVESRAKTNEKRSTMKTASSLPRPNKASSNKQRSQTEPETTSTGSRHAKSGKTAEVSVTPAPPPSSGRKVKPPTTKIATKSTPKASQAGKRKQVASPAAQPLPEPEPISDPFSAYPGARKTTVSLFAAEHDQVDRILDLLIKARRHRGGFSDAIKIALRLCPLDVKLIGEAWEEARADDKRTVRGRAQKS